VPIGTVSVHGLTALFWICIFYDKFRSESQLKGASGQKFVMLIKFNNGGMVNVVLKTESQENENTYLTAIKSAISVE
jgi:hypothetical protein